MTTILGLDISSFALHGCLLIDDQPPVLRMETLGKATEPLIERLRRVYRAMWNMNPITDEFGSPKADWVVIEDAFGKNRNADRALNRVIGAIIASVPSESQIAIVSTGDWRRALGAKNTKADGHLRVIGEITGWQPGTYREYDEHELDAIGLSLAWQRILAGQVAA